MAKKKQSKPKLNVVGAADDWQELVRRWYKEMSGKALRRFLFKSGHGRMAKTSVAPNCRYMVGYVEDGVSFEQKSAFFEAYKIVSGCKSVLVQSVGKHRYVLDPSDETKYVEVDGWKQLLFMPLDRDQEKKQLSEQTTEHKPKKDVKK